MHKSCETNLISFFDRVTGTMGRKEAVDVLCHDFSEAFVIASQIYKQTGEI